MLGRMLFANFRVPMTEELDPVLDHRLHLGMLGAYDHGDDVGYT